MKIQCGPRFEEATVEEIDRVAHRERRTRSNAIEILVEEALKNRRREEKNDK